MTQDPNNTFVTPPGRIVGGSCHTPFEKDSKKNPGEKYKEYVIMLALPKTEPTTAALVAQIKAIGTAAWGHNPTKLQVPTFAWKMIDGDSAVPNTEGRVPNTREGFPGHTIVTLTSRFAFVMMSADGKSQIDPASVQTGYWVRLAGNVVCNNNDQKPGVYLNLKGVQFIRKDVEIKVGGGMSAAEATAAFGAAPVAPTQAAPVAPAPTPATDIIQNALNAPAPPGVPAPPAPVAGPVLTPMGLQAGCDPTAWIAGGQWTMDLLKQHGYVQ